MSPAFHKYVEIRKQRKLLQEKGPSHWPESAALFTVECYWWDKIPRHERDEAYTW